MNELMTGKLRGRRAFTSHCVALEWLKAEFRNRNVFWTRGRY